MFMDLINTARYIDLVQIYQHRFISISERDRHCMIQEGCRMTGWTCLIARKIIIKIQLDGFMMQK